MTACVDARATYVLTDPERVAHHTASWRAGVEQRGRCFTVQPGERWERIVGIGGLVLMRRTPPLAGVPPLYFRADAAPAVLSGLYSSGALPPPEGVATTLPAPLPQAFQAARAPSSPAPVEVQDTGDAAAEVHTEDLPLLPVPAPRAPSAGPATAAPPPPATTPTLPAAPVAAVPIDPVPAAPVAPGALPRSDVSPAAARSYALGFTLVIVLIAVLLAAMVLLLRFLLRWSPDAEPSALRSSDTAPEKMLSRGQKPGRKIKPPASRPARRGPAVARIRTDPRLVTHRLVAVPVAPVMLQPAGLAPGSEAWLSEDGGDLQRHCALVLRDAGWEARIRPRIGLRQGDVVARRNGRIMALRCLPDTALVDEQAVEGVCMAREREQADVAVIVSNAIVTAGARRLAMQTGVDLLHEDELGRFAG